MKTIIVLLLILCSFKSQAQLFVGWTAGIENNKILGNAYNLGLDIDVQKNKNMYGFYFHIGLGPTLESELFIEHKANRYKVESLDSSVFTFEYGRVLYEKRSYIFQTIAGVGFKDIDYHEKYEKTNVVLSTGLSLRYIINYSYYDYYLELKLLYCLENHYKLLSEKIPSNSLKLNLIFGWTL